MFSKGIPDGEEYIGSALELELGLGLELELEDEISRLEDDEISRLEDDISRLEDDEISRLEDDIIWLELETSGIFLLELEGSSCSPQ